MKNRTLQIKIDKDEVKVIKELREKYNINISGFVRKSINDEYIKLNKKCLKK